MQFLKKHLIFGVLESSVLRPTEAFTIEARVLFSLCRCCIFPVTVVSVLNFGMCPSDWIKLSAKDKTMELATVKDSQNWDLEADVLIIGSGAAGLPAAIRAVEAGASVIVVETNYDVGGHAIISGGHMALGGGTSVRRNTASPIPRTRCSRI
jgi:FAD binding domain